MSNLEAQKDRRKLGLSLVAAGAAALLARTAEAFPRGFRRDLAEANQVLRLYGLRILGDVGDHDVLTTEVVPRPNTEYDFVVNEVEGAGELVPCIKTSFFNDVAEFQHFDLFNGEIIPCVRTLVDGPLITFEHFEPDEIPVPCVRVAIEGDVTTLEHFGGIDNPDLRVTLRDEVSLFEHYDPDKSPIDPCWVVQNVEGDERAVPSSLTFTVNDLALNLTVVIGNHTYMLRDGALVEV